MPLQEGLVSAEVPNLLGYGNVARVVKDGTADDFENLHGNMAGCVLADV